MPAWNAWHFFRRPSKATIGPEQYQALGQALQKIEAKELLPARTLAAIRLILRTGCRPHEILTAELAWVQPPILLGPDFDLETLADPEAYIRLAPRIERPRGKGDRHDSEKEGRTIWQLRGGAPLVPSELVSWATHRTASAERHGRTHTATVATESTYRKASTAIIIAISGIWKLCRYLFHCAALRRALSRTRRP
jgi:integrase